MSPVTSTNRDCVRLGFIAEDTHRVRGIALLETIWQDTGYALRTMRRNPLFAATAVLVLTLGIGGNAAMFTVIRAVLLKPLEYREPDRLVEVSD